MLAAAVGVGVQAGGCQGGLAISMVCSLLQAIGEGGGDGGHGLSGSTAPGKGHCCDLLARPVSQPDLPIFH